MFYIMQMREIPSSIEFCTYILMVNSFGILIENAQTTLKSIQLLKETTWNVSNHLVCLVPIHLLIDVSISNVCLPRSLGPSASFASDRNFWAIFAKVFKVIRISLWLGQRFCGMANWQLRLMTWKNGVSLNLNCVKCRSTHPKVFADENNFSECNVTSVFV